MKGGESISTIITWYRYNWYISHPYACSYVAIACHIILRTGGGGGDVAKMGCYLVLRTPTKWHPQDCSHMEIKDLTKRR